MKYSVILLGFVAISFGMKETTKAATIAGEHPVAGITISLDKYYESTKENNKISRSTTSVSSIVTKEQKNEIVQKELEQYKNIGIANVSKYLNIRSKASETSSIVGKLPKDGGCYIYSIDDKGWAKIKSGKITGYVASEYLITGTDVPALAKKVGQLVATVAADSVRIRSEKSTDAPIVTGVSKGEELEIIDNSDKNWAKVALDQTNAYISKDYITVSYQLKKAISYEEAVSATTGMSSVRSKMVSYAKQFLGNKYVYGGTSLSHGIDCSGFTMRIYQKFGYNITRTSRSQAVAGKRIKVSQVKPGDLVFYSEGGVIHHVAMYIGNGKVIHASNPRSGIKISNMMYRTPCKAVTFLKD